MPAIHPLPEYLATGRRAEWYEETKKVLQVPWMGVVTMAYSHYPAFFGELWRGLKPLCQSRPFVEAFLDLRDYVESWTAELNPASLMEPLKTMGYAPREIDAIRQMNTVFSHGNQLYVLTPLSPDTCLKLAICREKSMPSLLKGDTPRMSGCR